MLSCASALGKRAVAAAAVLVAFLSSSGAQGPPPSQAESQYFTLKFCSHAKVRVWFALVSRENPQAKEWYARGWWQADPGACLTAGQYPKDSIFLHAMGDRGVRWNGPDLKACVEPVRFKHTLYPDMKCDAPLVRGFYKRTVTGAEYTWTINQP